MVIVKYFPELSLSMIQELETDPKTVLKGKAAVVVVFYASWCEDSRRAEDYEKKLAEEFGGRVEFFRLDADEFADVADSYRVEHYPTYVFFRKGKPQRGVLVEPYSEGEARNWLEMKLGRTRV